MTLTEAQKKLLKCLPKEDRMRITNARTQSKFYQLINDDDTFKVSKVINKDILDALMDKAIEVVNEAYNDYLKQNPNNEPHNNSNPTPNDNPTT